MKALALVLALVACKKEPTVCDVVTEKEIACDPSLTDSAKRKLRDGTDIQLCREVLDGADIGPFTAVTKAKWQFESECAAKNATCDGYAACKATFDIKKAIDESPTK